jgi:hypothetical protein
VVGLEQSPAKIFLYGRLEFVLTCECPHAPGFDSMRSLQGQGLLRRYVAFGQSWVAIMGITKQLMTAGLR